MGYLRDVVGDENCRINLVTKINQDDHDQCHRDFALIDPTKRGQDDRHEDNPAGSKQDGGEKHHLDQSGDHRRDPDHGGEIFRAVLLFENRSDNQEQHHVRTEMIQRTVAEHMAKKPDESQRIGQWSPVDTEKQDIGIALGDQTQNQSDETQKEEGQDNGSVVFDSF